jgi:hypothetical protein
VNTIPRNKPANHSEDKALRVELLKAAMPSVISSLRPTDDLETVAQRITQLTHEIARRVD